MIDLWRDKLREDNVFGILALLVFFVPIFFTLLTYENFETPKFSSFLFLTGAGLLAFVFKHKYKKAALNFLPVKYYALSAFFLFFSALSSVFSLDAANSVFGFYYRFSNSLLFYFCWMLFVFLLLKVFSPEKKRILLDIFIFDSWLVGLYGLLQSVGIGYYEGLGQGFFTRAPSLLGNPNFSSLFAAMALPYAFNFFLNSSGKAKIYYGVSSCFIIAGVVAMSSRGSVLALTLGGLLWLALYLRRGFNRRSFFRAAIIFVFVFAAGMTMLNVVRPGTVKSVLNFSDPNAVLRSQVWQVACRGIADHPWLGTGPGNFQIFFEQARQAYISGPQGEFDDAHNLFIHLAVTGGLPLTAAFILFLLWPLAKNFCYAIKNDSLATANLVSMAIFFTGAMFNPVSVGVFVALGLVAAAGWHEFGSTEKKYASPRGLAPFGVVFSVFIICYGLALFAGEAVFSNAVRAYRAGDYNAAYKYSSLASFLNPPDSYIRVYKIASRIMVSQNLAGVQKEIDSFAGLHPLESRSWAFAGKLYLIIYYQSQDEKYLRLALHNIKKSLSIDPGYTDRYGLLAVYQFINNDLQGAQESLNKTLIQDYNNYGSWLLKARIYQLAGDRAAAVRSLERALALHPEFSALKQNLEELKWSPEVNRYPVPVFFNPTKLE